MAKLILSLDQVVIEEQIIDKPRLTIGRRPVNDIQIDNLAVSGEHAAIVQIGNDFFVEDLNSTNGTVVNDKPVKKHLLQHADVMTFGKFQLKYINEATLNPSGNASDDFEKTMIIRPQVIKATVAPDTINTASNNISQNNMSVADVHHTATSDALITKASSATVQEVEKPIVNTLPINTENSTSKPQLGGPLGKLQVLSGSSSGRELVLSKALTTLGKPGVQVAVITKRNNGYYITHVEGKTNPVVNGSSIGAQAHLLADHDVIELAGVKMEFYLAS